MGEQEIFSSFRAWMWNTKEYQDIDDDSLDQNKELTL